MSQTRLRVVVCQAVAFCLALCNVACQRSTVSPTFQAQRSPTESQRNGDEYNANRHHQAACAPRPPYLPAECEAGEKQEGHRDDVRQSQCECYVIEQEKRCSNREETEKDKKEDAKGRQIVFPVEWDLEALGRAPAEMDADALKVRLGERRHDGRPGRYFAIMARPAAGLSAMRIASTAERARWRSPRTPMRYMTASMMAQARLQPNIPMSMARTSARLASVAVRERVKVRTMIRPNSISLARDTGSSTRAVVVRLAPSR